MNQEQRPQPAGSRPILPASIRLALPFARKRFLLLLGITLALLAAAAGPSFIQATRAKFARILQSQGTPLPPSPLKTSAGAAENVSTTPPQEQTGLLPEAQAQQLWAEFEKSSWNAPQQEWSTLPPEIPCEPFRGGIYGQGTADRQWSHRCSASREPEAAHWSFYVFGLQEPLVPRLHQFDVAAPALPEEALSQVQNLLQTRLTARFGPAEDRSSKVARSRPVRWPENLRWQAPDLEIQLYLSEFDPQRRVGRLRLQGRQRALLEALNEDERLKLVGTSDFLYQAGSGIDAQLADKLRADFPDVATMLMKQQPDPDPQKMREAVQQWQNQLRSSHTSGQTGVRAAMIALPQSNWQAAQFRDALVKLLASARTSSFDRQPVLLLAADRLAGRLHWVMENDTSESAHWQEWRTQLVELGATYAPFFSAPPEYTGNLLNRVWTDFPESDWGERAFLLLLNHGWDPGVDCAGGSEQFRQVIQQGLQFREKHSKSLYLLDVQLAVAQAYETWWSLSQAVATGDEYSEGVEPGKYQDGAEAARQKALASYEQLLEIAPQSDHAAYARRILPRLTLGIDTGQRRFYCTVGD